MRYNLLAAIALIALAALVHTVPAQAQDQKTIILVQILLDDLGYDPGPLDGTTGPQTTAAISAFEERAGNPVTAKVSSDLVIDLMVFALAERYADFDNLDEESLDQERSSLRTVPSDQMIDGLRSSGALGGKL